LENFLKVITPANKKAWEDLKVHMIGMIIVDEIVELKQIGMNVFAFSKLWTGCKRGIRDSWEACEV
jgi:hypothetical protein